MKSTKGRLGQVISAPILSHAHAHTRARTHTHKVKVGIAYEKMVGI